MNDNLKKVVTCLLILTAALTVCARPHHGPRHGHRPPVHHHGHHHHHHHHSKGVAIGAGILGAGLLASTIYNATRPTVVVEQPVVVTPPAVVTPAPVVVTPAPVVTTGHYETRVENVWVEGRYVDQVGANGVVVRVWQPGHYEQRSTQVWVP